MLRWLVLGLGEPELYHSPHHPKVQLLHLVASTIAFTDTFLLQPPIWSMMSAGHSTARNRSLMACLSEWTTISPETWTLSHLFRAALAELALVVGLYIAITVNDDIGRLNKTDVQRAISI